MLTHRWAVQCAKSGRWHLQFWFDEATCFGCQAGACLALCHCLHLSTQEATAEMGKMLRSEDSFVLYDCATVKHVSQIVKQAVSWRIAGQMEWRAPQGVARWQASGWKTPIFARGR